MSEEIKTILEEIRFKAGIYRDHKKRNLSFNDEQKNCALLLDYIRQKENIIKEAREYIKTLRNYRFNVDLGENREQLEIVGSTENFVKDILEILDKENK